MIYSILQSLDKDWSIDDKPQYWQGVIKDPEYYATYNDVEYCLNNAQFFDIHIENLFFLDVSTEKLDLKHLQLECSFHHLLTYL